ncbi:unnamed protein product [Cochlearia groenlandica]
MEEENNSNSHERQRGGDTPKSWSELPLDLLLSVLESLSFANFQAAKSVCSSWHSGSRRCVLKNQIHWLILFPEDKKKNNSCCWLFNPEEEEKDKFYKTKDLSLEFAESVCKETYGSWKRDNSWNQIPETSYCCDMVYKDSKLYFLSLRRMFRIYDFSGEIPIQTFHCGVNVESFYFGLGIHGRTSHWGIVATKLVVRVTGEVLKVEQLKSRSQTRSFRVFKVYSSGFLEKKELVHSLGDESMLLDQGITVLASDTDGLFIKNSIYFSVNEEKNVHDMFLFNLETKKTEPLHKFDSSLVRFSTSRWFLPSFR